MCPACASTVTLPVLGATSTEGLAALVAAGSDFNYDFHVSFRPEEIVNGTVYYNYELRDFMVDELSGDSVFYKDAAGDVFHTYSTYGRGGEEFLGTYRILDVMPKGRNENGPGRNLTDWVRHHDRYGDRGHVAPTGRYVTEDRL